MPLVGDPHDWGPDTQQGVIFAALKGLPDAGHRPKNCPVCMTTWRGLVPALGAGALRFYANGPSGRVELPQGRERSRRLRNKVHEVHAYCAAYMPGEASSEASEPKPEPKPPKAEPKAPKAVGAEHERFYREVQRLRRFTADRGSFDSLESMRVVIDGAKAINGGVPVNGLLASMTATWQTDSRVQAQIADFDFAGWRKASDAKAHGVSEYVLALVRSGVNVWLHGPAGTGKSSAARYAAEQLGLDYYEVNLAGAMASAIKGKDRLKEFIESEFTKAYRDGGILCLEEFDAAHPTVATAVNNAIANEHFHNDASGEVIERHPNFRVVVTANTLGTGATKEFNGRLKLDGATIDRFRMGRVYVGLDTNLERAIFESLATI